MANPRTSIAVPPGLKKRCEKADAKHSPTPVGWTTQLVIAAEKWFAQQDSEAKAK